MNFPAQVSFIIFNTLENVRWSRLAIIIYFSYGTEIIIYFRYRSVIIIYYSYRSKIIIYFRYRSVIIIYYSYRREIIIITLQPTGVGSSEKIFIDDRRLGSAAVACAFLISRQNTTLGGQA
jgi:hypothetical protein